MGHLISFFDPLSLLSNWAKELVGLHKWKSQPNLWSFSSPELSLSFQASYCWSRSQCGTWLTIQLLPNFKTPFSVVGWIQSSNFCTKMGERKSKLLYKACCLHCKGGMQIWAMPFCLLAGPPFLVSEIPGDCVNVTLQRHMMAQNIESRNHMSQVLPVAGGHVGSPRMVPYHHSYYQERSPITIAVATAAHAGLTRKKLGSL